MLDEAMTDTINPFRPSEPPSSGADSGRLTQAERRERSELELLEATMRVVSEQGVAAATFDAIGKEATE